MTAEQSRKFFTADQAQLITLVLDIIIPRKGGNPGAGEFGVTSYIDNFLSENPASRRNFEEGLRLIEITSVAEHTAEFATLGLEQRTGVLQLVESNSPAFFSILVTQTYNGYYSDQRTALRLGLESASPQPKGHVVEIGNLSLIENVKKRGQMFREA